MLLFARAFNELYTYFGRRTRSVKYMHVARTLQTRMRTHTTKIHVHKRYILRQVVAFLHNLMRENKTDSFYKVSTKYGKAQRA